LRDEADCSPCWNEAASKALVSSGRRRTKRRNYC
jgi:hypothetical protein